jgi:DNA-binding NarL/FixJ family response regulator
MSMYGDEVFIAQAVINGASAYVLKQAGNTDLVEAVYAVTCGEHFFSKPFSSERIENYIQEAKIVNTSLYESLTTREQEILRLVVEGKTSQQIALDLFISPRTVDVHRANLMRKLNVRTKSDLIRYALRHGLILE